MKFELGGVEFSMLPDNPLRVREWDSGSADVIVNDEKLPQRDGVIPGEDWLGANTWVWNISARGANIGEVLALNARLKRAWRSVRPRATIKVPLRYQLDGRWRRVYGRPGRYSDVTVDTLAMNGVGRITADFRVLDPLHYDDREQRVRLDIVPASSGGLTAPLVAPLTSVGRAADRAGFVSNGGDAKTPLKVRFHGPVRNPYVRSAAGWEIGVSGSLAYDQTLTVDPLAGTVTIAGGGKGNVPADGMLNHKTRLTDTLLPVGQSELTFGGTDSTGTSYAELFWRDAYHSL